LGRTPLLTGLYRFLPRRTVFMGSVEMLNSI
jgi:hypothetical protein